MQVDRAVRDRLLERNVAVPHPRDRAAIGRDEEINIQARIGNAELDSVGIANDPSVAFSLGLVRKLETDHNTRGGHAIEIHAPMQIPQDQPWIGVPTFEGGRKPTLAPFAESDHEWGKLAAGFRQHVLDTCVCASPLYNSSLLEGLQPLRQQ